MVARSILTDVSQKSRKAYGGHYWAGNGSGKSTPSQNYEWLPESFGGTVTIKDLTAIDDCLGSAALSGHGLPEPR